MGMTENKNVWCEGILGRGNPPGELSRGAVWGVFPHEGELGEFHFLPFFQN